MLDVFWGCQEMVLDRKGYFPSLRASMVCQHVLRAWLSSLGASIS